MWRQALISLMVETLQGKNFFTFMEQSDGTSATQFHPKYREIKPLCMDFVHK